MPEQGRSFRRQAGEQAPRRARAVTRIADLRPTDRVLDVGCGWGEVATVVAPYVEHVHGLDLQADRVQRAGERAAEAGLGNTSFEAIALQDYPFEPLSWDVTLFMRVWGKEIAGPAVGEDDLVKILSATRRQAVMQVGKPRRRHRIGRVLELCEEEGFDAGWFVGLHLVIANRRGTDAVVHEVPDRVLTSTPAGPEVVATETMPDHPLVKSYGRALSRAS